MSQFDPKLLYLFTPKPNETAEEFNQRAEEELRLREIIYEEEKRRRAEEQNREMRERARWSTKREPQTPEERKAALIRDAEMYNTTREMMKQMQQNTNSQREKQLIQQLEQQQLERQKLQQQELQKLLEEELAQQSQQQQQSQQPQQPYSYNPLSLLKGLKTRVTGLLPGKRGVNGGKLSVGKRSTNKKGKKSQKSRRHSRHSKRK